jgi:HAD superfamily phosphoserine phosphatase-like hydrolase
MGLAIFDLDGTLVPFPTSQRRLFRRLVGHGHVDPLSALGRLGVTATRLFVCGKRCAQASGAYLAGLPVAAVHEEARALVESDLLPDVRSRMLDRIHAHRRRGDYVALVSGAPSFIVREFGRQLGFDAAIGSEPRHRDGLFVDAPVRLHVAGPNKRRVVESLCRWLQIAPAACAAYADSADDRWLLSWVDRPVAVAPDARLRRIARRRGWECIEAV